MSAAYVLAACRTAMGKLNGELASLSAPELAAYTIRQIINNLPIEPHSIQDVILGQVIQAGVGQAPARKAMLLAGLPNTIPALTINQVCGSGLRAVMLAAQAIRAGESNCILAGGMESMSQSPHLLSARNGFKFGHGELKDSLLNDGLTCSTEHLAMGNIAEQVAVDHNISRAEQDAFALRSHSLAAQYAATGGFASEIVSISVLCGKTTKLIQADETIRPDVTLESLTKLRPAFTNNGTVTAGNASQISDGAAVLLLGNEVFAKQYPTNLQAKIVATVSVACPPRDLFLAPVAAMRQLLAKTGLSIHDIDLIEMNEAFAVQCLACVRELSLPLEKVNIHGGAIALGHPLGASGARILVTLLHNLAQQNLQRGIAFLCLGGGGAVGILVERVR